MTIEIDGDSFCSLEEELDECAKKFLRGENCALATIPRSEKTIQGSWLAEQLRLNCGSTAMPHFTPGKNATIP